MNTSEDPEILFSSTMRALLSEIDATVTEESGRTIFQDGNANFNLQNVPLEVFPDVTKPPICIHAQHDLQAVQKIPPISLKLPLLPVPRPAIRATSELIIVHEDPPPNSRIDQIESNFRLEIPRRPADYVKIQRLVTNKHALNLLQAFRAWIQGQLREVVDYDVSFDHISRNSDQHERNVPQSFVRQDLGSPTLIQQISQRWSDEIEMSGELHHQCPVDVSRHAPWETDATPTIRTQERSSFSIELMNIDSEADETGNSEPALLDEPDNLLERSLVLSRDARAGYIYRPSDSACGIVVGIRSYPRDMEPQGHETAYQHKGTVDSVVCTEAQECGESISVSLFRKHTLLCLEIRGHSLPGTAGINRKDMVSLPQDQNSLASDLCVIRTRSSERPQQTDSTNRMFFIVRDIHNT
ncbi:hypothetical protein AYI70_g9076 [Smittium culicis]|uniref:Uncharacterized protein n=1 Tax=Smittium culicis TaxID=133412 RepID=A0A1R1XCZ1_9FUNG|nr:hypothetical protein AYI70_g9076 [Smittium culicis]